MLLLPCLLIAALVLAIWLGTFAAMCLMSAARWHESRNFPNSAGRLAHEQKLSTSDVRFLHECGIRTEPAPDATAAEPDGEHAAVASRPD